MLFQLLKIALIRSDFIPLLSSYFSKHLKTKLWTRKDTEFAYNDSSCYVLAPLQASVLRSNLLKHYHTKCIVFGCLLSLDKWITLPVKSLAWCSCCFFSLERFVAASRARVALFIQAWLHGDQHQCHYTAWKITVLRHTLPRCVE